MASIVAAMVTPEEYRESRAHIFPSAGALEWFMRQNRRLLIDEEAILIVANRTKIIPERFDAAVVTAGRLALERKSAR